VNVVVPHERGNPLSPLHAELAQRSDQGLRAAVEVRVAVPVQRLVGHARDDLGAREQPARALEDVREGQGKIHHRVLHGSLV
jgi:hypothetical protein